MTKLLNIKLNSKLYIKDPEETELGRRILSESIRLIDELGFENFSFKKLAVELNSTESSIYRYFENKQKLLNYLTSWYWTWLDYQISLQIINVDNPKAKLQKVLKILCESRRHIFAGDMDNVTLHRIIVFESAKAYLNKDISTSNKDGFFNEYKKVCKNIAKLIYEINPDYPYAHSLVSMLIETSHQQVLFAKFLPSLTDLKMNGEECDKLDLYLEHILFSSINKILL